jgi:peroxiredoxin
VELPRLEPLWKKYRDQGLSVVAINTYPDTPGALEFFEEHGLTFPQLADRDRKYKEGVLGLYGHPMTLILDDGLRILFLKFGFEEGDEAKLESRILRLMKERETEL